MVKRKALVIGATGATGKELVSQLTDNENYEMITVLHYRETDQFTHKKVMVSTHPFDALLDFRLENVDDVFCCIGTTIKKAGSQEQFAKVDRDYVLHLGKWAKINDVVSFHVISYLGADSASSIFYNRVKGEMESGLIDLNLNSLYIYHPPLLIAERDEFRLGEKVGAALFTILKPFMIGGLKKHRPLNVKKLAASMIEHAIDHKPGLHYVSSEEMQEQKKPDQ